MMILEAAEQSLKDALIAKGYEGKFRGFHLDDELDKELEREEYPCILIVAHPPSDIQRQKNLQDIRVDIEVNTYITDDPKRTVFKGIVGKVLEVIKENSLVSPDAQYSFAHILKDEGGVSFLDSRKNVSATPVVIRACQHQV